MPLPSATRSPKPKSATHHQSLPTSAKLGSYHDPQKPMPPDLSIAPITPTTLPAYRRLITLLLPIRYPDKFYKDSVANPTPSSLALCALWPEIPRPGKRKLDSLNGESSSSPSSIDGPGANVVGGIQCRLEPLTCSPPTSSTAPAPPQQQPYNLYIQTLAVLSPYRSLGIATALLDAIICTVLAQYPRQNINVKEIYAHVWESNEEATQWYMKRGFEVEEEVVEGYYKKLRPSGARVVRRRVRVGDWIGAVGGFDLKKDPGESGKSMDKDQEQDLERKEGRENG